MIKTIFCSILIMNSILLVSSKKYYIEPESTILYYYKSMENNDVVAVNSCFKNGNFNKNTVGKYWLSYRIVYKRKFDKKAVEEFKKKIDFEYSSENQPKEDDVEIIVENTEKIQNQIKEVKFWYLLREIQGKWLIISHSAMINYD